VLMGKKVVIEGRYLDPEKRPWIVPLLRVLAAIEAASIAWKWYISKDVPPHEHLMCLAFAVAATTEAERTYRRHLADKAGDLAAQGSPCEWLTDTKQKLEYLRRPDIRRFCDQMRKRIRNKSMYHFDDEQIRCFCQWAKEEQDTVDLWRSASADPRSAWWDVVGLMFGYWLSDGGIVDTCKTAEWAKKMGRVMGALRAIIEPTLVALLPEVCEADEEG